MDKLPTLEKIAENPALLEKHLVPAIETGMTVITTYGLKMIGAVLILIICWTVSGMVQNAIIKAGKHTPRIDITIFTFLGSVAKYAVLFFTIVAMLSSFGVETTSFVAVLGAVGLAIGLALQGAHIRLLGTTTLMLSAVEISVVNSKISVIVPATPAASTESPTRNGRKKISIKPAAM